MDATKLALILKLVDAVGVSCPQNQEPPEPLRNPRFDFEVGKPYLIQTVTLYFTGIFQDFNGHELVFSDAAWIPDIGRAKEAYEKGTFLEVEPCPEKTMIFIGRGAVVTAMKTSFQPPRSQK